MATISSAALALGAAGPVSAAPVAGSLGALLPIGSTSDGQQHPNGSLQYPLQYPSVPLDRTLDAAITVGALGVPVEEMRIVLDLPTGGVAAGSAEVVVSTPSSTLRSTVPVVLTARGKGRSATVTIPGPINPESTVFAQLAIGGVAAGAPLTGYVSADLGGASGTGTQIGAVLAADGSARLG